jgi:hypothetical protein
MNSPTESHHNKRDDRSRLPSTLTSKVFVCAIGLLLLNDFLLKPLFHNWITGKLSDFAGLYALGLLLASMSPKRARVSLCVLALAFAFWKSEFATPFITQFNWISPLSIWRVADATDLLALIILLVVPASLKNIWAIQNKNVAPRDWRVVVACVVTLFAFCATSRLGSRLRCDRAYYFKASPEEVHHVLDSLYMLDWARHLDDSTENSIFLVAYDSELQDTIRVQGNLKSTNSYPGARSELEITEIFSERNRSAESHLRDAFVSTILVKLPGNVGEKGLWHWPRFDVDWGFEWIFLVLGLLVELIVLIPSILMWRSQKQLKRADGVSRLSGMSIVIYAMTVFYTILFLFVLFRMTVLVD